MLLKMKFSIFSPDANLCFPKPYSACPLNSYLCEYKLVSTFQIHVMVIKGLKDWREKVRVDCEMLCLSQQMQTKSLIVRQVHFINSVTHDDFP